MYSRQAKEAIIKKLFGGKTLIILGPRQVGKTTLIKSVLRGADKTFLALDADDPTVRSLLTDPNTAQLKQILGEHDLIFIDEAQRIPRIGLTAKIIHDQFEDKQLILSGSSSFDLSHEMHEPLTGRKWTFQLYPISWEEWQETVGFVKAEQELENRLVYGFYPDVLNHPDDAQDVLMELVDSYLYKDLLAYDGIRKPSIIQKLVQALAHQVGSEVVYKELGDLLKLDPKTVSHYLDVLEKAFIIFRLPSFSRNLRNEIKTNQKVYFYDNGVRNAVINKMNMLPNREDVGALWENFLISERVKQLSYARDHRRYYFWRTKQQQEVDFVEDTGNGISGYEFKWNPRKTIRLPKTFVETYNATAAGITRKNFRDFVMSSDL